MISEVWIITRFRIRPINRRLSKEVLWILASGKARGCVRKPYTWRIGGASLFAKEYGTWCVTLKTISANPRSIAL